MAKIHFTPESKSQTAFNTYRGSKTEAHAWCGSVSYRSRSWWVTNNMDLVTCSKCQTHGERYQDASDKITASVPETLESQLRRELQDGTIRTV